MGDLMMVVDYKRNKAHVAQQAEQGFCKPQVGSSILSMGSTIRRVSYSGNTSAFQADAGSSILPTRSKLL